MFECVWGKNKLDLELKGWHQNLHLILPCFNRPCSFEEKRGVITMYSLKVIVFKMTLKEYGSFTTVEGTYPALRKRLRSHVDAPSFFPRFLCCQDTICPE